METSLDDDGGVTSAPSKRGTDRQAARKPETANIICNP